MIAYFFSIWSLFFGILLITIANGLQGTLLSVRGVMEGFSTESVGAIMSAYYGGFFLGSLQIPKLVRNVGHVRVFAALASLASVTILAHSVILNPLIWGTIRFASGFSFAGLYIVAESWLNDQSENATRGKFLSIYMAINHGGFFLGQLFLNLGHPQNHFLFILISILLSFSLIPILITVSPTPSFEDPDPINVKKLYNISPLGMVGVAGVGVAHGSIWGMGSVFAQGIGFDIQSISIFMGVLILGGFIFQWPVGILSDRYDRRAALNILMWLAGGSSLLCALIPQSQTQLILLGAFLLGGLTLPLYSLCIAHTNDHLVRNQMVSASSAMVLVYGGGAFFGPMLASVWMNLLGPFGLFFHLFTIHFLLGVFVLYRIRKRAPVPLEEQEPFTPIPPGTSPVVAVLTPGDTSDESANNSEKDVANF